MIIFILAQQSTMAQKVLIDSLLLYSQKKKGLEKAMVLVELSNAAVYTVTADALRYAEEAYKIAQKHQHDSIQYAALKAIGYANGYLGRFDNSLQNMRDGLDYYETIKDSARIAEAISDIAYLLQATTNEHEEIMGLNLHALSIREALNDKKGIAYSLNNIGAYLWDWDRKSEAMGYFERAAPLMQELNLIEEYAFVNNNIGAYYVNIEQYDSASSYLKQALDAFISIDHRLGQAQVMVSQSSIALANKQNNEALHLLNEARVLQEMAGDKSGLVETLYNMAFILLQNNKVKQSEQLALKAEQLTIEIACVKKLSVIYELLAQCSEHQGNYKSAYAYLSKGKVLQDSLFNKEKHEQIEELHTKYNTDKKEDENEQLLLKTKNQELFLKRNKLVLIGTIILTFLVVAFFWLLYYNSRAQDKMRSLISDQRLLRSQMNPHFIFNAISAIQNDILTKPPRESVQHLSKFASLIRQFLDSSKRDFIELSAENNLLKNYMTIQQLRYSHKFDYTIEVDESIDEDITLVPPLLSQTIIENAIEHGLKQLKEKGFVHLKYERKENLIHITIEDNGVGINNCLENHSHEHKAFALEATKKRLKMLHKKNRKNFLFEVLDKSDLDCEKRGTLVRYSIPLVEEF